MSGTLIDVRTPAEFAAAHIPGSYNVPLAVLEQHASAVGARLPAGPVTLVCQSGVRAEQARRRLAEVGVDRTSVLDGGLSRYPGEVLRGRGRWALERQVRLVAGTLVLTGLAVGLRAPAGRLLSAGIGAGLTVSALTNTCAMGRMLAALPYNRGPREHTAAEVLAALPTTAG